MQGFEARAQASTWLYRICTNVCLNLLRKRNVRVAKHRDSPGAVDWRASRTVVPDGHEAERTAAGVKPTVRTSDGRIWGPSQAPAGQWQRVEIRKLVGEDAEFPWAIEVAAAKEGPWQGLVVGAPESITYDGDVAREILGRDHAGVLRITADGKRCNRSLILHLEGFQGEAAAGRPGSGQDPSEGEFRFRRECDGSGQMDWGLLSDHPRRDCRVSSVDLHGGPLERPERRTR